MARSAGTGVQLIAKEGGFATLRLPSGEMRLVDSRCKATVGVVGNPEHELVSWGKAGRSRWLGKRPDQKRAVVKLASGDSIEIFEAKGP